MTERGGKNAKKRAIVAVARKLAVLLHRLWVHGGHLPTSAERDGMVSWIGASTSQLMQYDFHELKRKLG